MRIEELMEAKAEDVIEQIRWNAADLEKIFSVELPHIYNKYKEKLTVSDDADEVERGLVKNYHTAFRSEIARPQSMWFKDKYMSVSARSHFSQEVARDGLKNGLSQLAEMGAFRNIPFLKELAHLPVMMDPKTGGPDTASSKLMGEIVSKLPEVLFNIGRIANNKRVFELGKSLANSIKSWDKLYSTVQAAPTSSIKFKKKGDAYISNKTNPNKDAWKSNSDIVKSTKKPVKHDTHAQNMSQVDVLINHALSQLDSKTAHEIRTAIARSDNKLMAMSQELHKRNIQMESMFE